MSMMNRVRFVLSVAAVVMSVSTASAPPSAPAAPSSTAHDFDFLLGNWTVHNRKLAKHLAGSHEWVEFEAADSFHDLPGGLGTEENYKTDYWPGFNAVGLHLYDPEKKRWTLYWADSRNSPGVMQTLASGTFERDAGTFY